jgi:type IV pilus assembly protein PilA
MDQNRGFSVIELLIVVAILLVIAAIAIPKYLEAKVSADEAAAVSTIRTLATAEVAYLNSYPTVGYAATLSDLGTGGNVPCVPSPNTACMIDTSLANAGAPPGKQGYVFAATGTSGSYLVTAFPVTTLGAPRSFCEVADNIPRVNPAGTSITSISSCLSLQAIR